MSLSYGQFNCKLFRRGEQSPALLREIDREVRTLPQVQGLLEIKTVKYLDQFWPEHLGERVFPDCLVDWPNILGMFYSAGYNFQHTAALIQSCIVDAEDFLAEMIDTPGVHSDQRRVVISGIHIWRHLMEINWYFSQHYRAVLRNN